MSFTHLESWQRYLSAQKNPQGYPVAASTIVKKLTNVRLLFGWLVKRQYLLYNPARDLELPRTDKGLPRHILSEEETARILTLTNSDTPLGLRDRAIMEMLWSSGIRRSELQRLQVGDVDFGRGVLFIRLGKGRKDRVVPFGKSAQQWTQSYLAELRPRLVWGKDPGYLFVSNKGKGLTDGSLTQIVRNALHRAEVEKPGGCHLFRHAMATQMLENGADTRHIQAILGHASLETTQIYTRVAIGHLKAVHQQTHPAERDHTVNSNTGAPESRSVSASSEPEAEPKQPASDSLPVPVELAGIGAGADRGRTARWHQCLRGYVGNGRLERLFPRSVGAGRPKPTQHNAGRLCAPHRAGIAAKISTAKRLAAHNPHYVLRPRLSASPGSPHKAAPSAVSIEALSWQTQRQP